MAARVPTGAARLILVFGGLEGLGAWEFSYKARRVVDEKRQVLRADPERATAIFECDQRDRLRAAIARHTLLHLIFCHAVPPFSRSSATCVSGGV